MRARELALCLMMASAACGPQLDVGETRGARAIQSRGCGGCHEIGGVPGASGRVGPPLKGVTSRMYVGGMLLNTPQNLALWIRDPRSVNPKTAMPTLGVTEEEAEDISAYLRTQ